jgi:hypothetical protein
MSESSKQAVNARAGLCERCRFMRRVESDRGSVFYLCQLSATDKRFPKYPRLPVLQCGGFAELEPGDRPASS